MEPRLNKDLQRTSECTEDGTAIIVV